MNNHEIWKWSAVETSKAVKNNKISATESIESSLKRLDEVNSGVNAVVVTTKKEAIKKAQDIDNKIKNKEKVGSLAGVPITIKENVDVKDKTLL